MEERNALFGLKCSLRIIEGRLEHAMEMLRVLHRSRYRAEAVKLGISLHAIHRSIKYIIVPQGLRNAMDREPLVPDKYKTIELPYDKG